MLAYHRNLLGLRCCQIHMADHGRLLISLRKKADLHSFETRHNKTIIDHHRILLRDNSSGLNKMLIADQRWI